MTYLWTGIGDPPWELTSYIMRRDIYHCTAAELDETDWQDLADDLAVRGAIHKVTRANRK